MPVAGFLTFGKHCLLTRAVLGKPILPFASFAIVADGCVERSIAAQPAVHVDYVLFSNTQPFGDDLHLIGAKITFLQSRDLAPRFAQIEKQLLLVGRGAHLHQRPRAQDVFLGSPP